MAMNHCLEAGGKHVEPGHFKLMMAGAEMCQTAANQIVIGMCQHQHLPRVRRDLRGTRAGLRSHRCMR